MSTVALCNLSLFLFFSILFLPFTVSASDPPQHSPSPAPLSLPVYQSPPAPPSPTPSPLSSPSPTPSPLSSPSPAPALDPPPADADNENKISNNSNFKDSASGGMSSGQKAGIALGVIAGACAVILGGVMYKKRQNNIRRSRFGYPSRIEII